jgi:hypothetical protein
MGFVVTLRIVLSNGDHCTLRVFIAWTVAQCQHDANRAGIARIRDKFPELHKARRIRATCFH